MTGMLFDPARLPERADDGFIWHPDLDQFMRGADGGAPQQEESDYMDMDALAALVEIRHLYADEDIVEFDTDAEAPQGDGWLLVGLMENPDGGVNALWVRPLPETAP
jgi:hypothetical protein